jgi:ribonuclease D
MTTPSPQYRLIKDQANLISLVETLSKEPEIAVDLEADSLFHYRERICLLQFSTPSQNFLLDPLSLNDLSPLVPVFSNARIRKIFHGADYDIRSLYRDFQIEVHHLFDTQIAASFLGVVETGLAALCKNKLALDLDKKYQRRDWSIRPLSKAMLTYAVYDTCYLLELSRILEKELRDKGRLKWVEEECVLQTQVRPLAPDNDPLYVRFKHARKLDPRGLAILESVLKLRDQLARQRNRPPFKILGNEAILETARIRPQSLQDLEQIKGISPGQINAMGRDLLKRVRECLILPPNQLPAFPPKKRSHTSPGLRKKVKRLKSWREGRAGVMGIDPALLLTNAQIASLTRISPQNPKELERTDLLRKWQSTLYGEDILSLLKTSPPTSSAGE